MIFQVKGKQTEVEPVAALSLSRLNEREVGLFVQQADGTEIMLMCFGCNGQFSRFGNVPESFGLKLNAAGEISERR